MSSATITPTARVPFSTGMLAAAKLPLIVLVLLIGTPGCAAVSHSASDDGSSDSSSSSSERTDFAPTDAQPLTVVEKQGMLQSMMPELADMQAATAEGLAGQPFAIDENGAVNLTQEQIEAMEAMVGADDVDLDVDDDGDLDVVELVLWILLILGILTLLAIIF